MCWMKAENSSLDRVERAIASLVGIHLAHITTDKLKIVHAQMNEPVLPIARTEQSLFPNARCSYIPSFCAHGMCFHLRKADFIVFKGVHFQINKYKLAK